MTTIIRGLLPPAKAENGAWEVWTDAGLLVARVNRNGSWGFWERHVPMTVILTLLQLYRKDNND